MENYVINPQVFYWISVLSILQTVFATIGVIFATAFICLVTGWVYNAVEMKRGYERNALYMKVFKTWTIVTGIVSFVLITAAIFIPGRTTSIEMLIAKTATFDNVNWTVQQVKDIVDYIITAIKSI